MVPDTTVVLLTAYGTYHHPNQQYNCQSPRGTPSPKGRWAKN